MILHVFKCQFGTLRPTALQYSVFQRGLASGLVRWLRQDSCFLHLSLKCFRSLIPVAVQIVSVPGLWNNRQGKQQNASLTEQPANQVRFAYRLEEKLRVYVLPRSMLCCCIYKSGRSGPMSFSLFLSTSDRRFESFQSPYSQNQSLC